MYETCHDDLPPYLGGHNLQLQCTDTDSFLLDFATHSLVTDLKNFQEEFHKFDLSILKKHPELKDTANGKPTGKFQSKTPSTIDVKEFCTLKVRAKWKLCAYCSKLNDENKNFKKCKKSYESSINNVELDALSYCLDDTITGKQKFLKNTTIRCKNHKGIEKKPKKPNSKKSRTNWIFRKNLSRARGRYWF